MEVVYINPTTESTWPMLDRTAFLIEHACVPKYIPSYPAEIAQLLAGLDAYLLQCSQQESIVNKECQSGPP